MAPNRKTRGRPGDASAAHEERLHRIIRVLGAHSTVVVSGARMAQEISASRSAVWRMVQQLRGYGVRIEGHPTSGYLLKEVPDLALPHILSPLIPGTIFTDKLRHFFSVESTNLLAMQAASEGAPEGATFLAEEQLAGRGRGGHDWHSEKAAGIYVSVILRPSLPPAEILKLSLAAGLAAQHAVEEVTGLRADLRWPNDLMLHGRKFGGILAEMNSEPARVRYLALGIGINVGHRRFPPALGDTATSLLLELPAAGAANATIARLPLIAALLKSLHREYAALVAGDPIIPRFAQNSSYAQGKPVRVDEQGGYEGETCGLDERGFLLVRTPNGVRTVISGGVREKVG